MQHLVRARVISATAAIAAIALGGVAQADRPQKPSYGSPAEAKWMPTGIGPDASPIKGDLSKGAHVTYIRFAAGFKTPLHTHSADYVGFVVSGDMRHFIPGDAATERRLPAGSHWAMPAKVQHISECLAGAECVVILIQDKSFDFKPAPTAKPPKK